MFDSSVVSIFSYFYLMPIPTTWMQLGCISDTVWNAVFIDFTDIGRMDAETRESYPVNISN